MTEKDYRLDKRYHYTHLLNAEEQRLYRLMLDSAVKRQYKFIHTDWYKPEMLPEEFRALPTLTYDTKDFVYTGLVYDSLLWDFPELFYIRQDKIGMLYEYPVYDLEPEEGAYSEDEIREIECEMDRIYHSFDAYKTGIELEIAVNDYLEKNYIYSESCDSYSGKKWHEIFNMVGLIKYGEGVCSAFTRLAQYIFTRRGMEVAVLISNPPGDERAHSWLAVKIRGKFYHLDITSNKSQAQEPYWVQKIDFNITDREMMEGHPYYLKDRYVGIECRSRRDNYYRARGLYFRTEPELSAAVRAFAEERRESRCEEYFYFRVPKSFREKRVCAAILEGVRNIPHKSVKYFDCNGYYAVEFVFNQK